MLKTLQSNRMSFRTCVHVRLHTSVALFAAFMLPSNIAGAALALHLLVSSVSEAVHTRTQYDHLCILSYHTRNGSRELSSLDFDCQEFVMSHETGVIHHASVRTVLCRCTGRIPEKKKLCTPAIPSRLPWFNLLIPCS